MTSGRELMLHLVPNTQLCKSLSYADSSKLTLPHKGGTCGRETITAMVFLPEEDSFSYIKHLSMSHTSEERSAVVDVGKARVLQLCGSDCST